MTDGAVVNKTAVTLDAPVELMRGRASSLSFVFPPVLTFVSAPENEARGSLVVFLGAGQAVEQRAWG
jgi:hypothetical protein